MKMKEGEEKCFPSFEAECLAMSMSSFIFLDIRKESKKNLLLNWFDDFARNVRPS